jgi:hypothetical protein
MSIWCWNRARAEWEIAESCRRSCAGLPDKGWSRPSPATAHARSRGSGLLSQTSSVDRAAQSVRQQCQANPATSPRRSRSRAMGRVATNAPCFRAIASPRSSPLPSWQAFPAGKSSVGSRLSFWLRILRDRS